MTDPIIPSETIFSDSHGLEVTALQGSRNIFSTIVNSTIRVSLLTRRLQLNNCRKVTILCTRIPAMGMHINHCTDITILIDDPVGIMGKESGYIGLDDVVICSITSYRALRIEVSRSSDVIFNGTNISDEYCDSTWELSPK